MAKINFANFTKLTAVPNARRLRLGLNRGKIMKRFHAHYDATKKLLTATEVAQEDKIDAYERSSIRPEIVHDLMEALLPRISDLIDCSLCYEGATLIYVTVKGNGYCNTAKFVRVFYGEDNSMVIAAI